MSLDPLDMLNELQRHEVEAALADPVQRERLQVTVLVQLRDSVESLRLKESAAKDRCVNVCRPGIVTRFERLEQFRARLMGIGAAIVALSAIFFALWEILK